MVAVGGPQGEPFLKLSSAVALKDLHSGRGKGHGAKIPSVSERVKPPAPSVSRQRVVITSLGAGAPDF